MTKADTVFRKRSIERISSPEQLDDYIQLSDPGVWFVLAAIMIILAGTIVFGIFGRIDSGVPAFGIAEDGKLICYTEKKYESRFTDEMQAKIDGKKYEVKLSDRQPVKVENVLDMSMFEQEDLEATDYVYEIRVYGSFADGTYDAEIVTESVSPLSFLFNTNEK